MRRLASRYFGYWHAMLMLIHSPFNMTQLRNSFLRNLIFQLQFFERMTTYPNVAQLAPNYATYTLSCEGNLYKILKDKSLSICLYFMGCIMQDNNVFFKASNDRYFTQNFQVNSSKNHFEVLFISEANGANKQKKNIHQKKLLYALGARSTCWTHRLLVTYLAL